MIVSDNGRQFTSEEFLQFVKANRIQHIFTAPGHPATNGQAENFVKTFKKSIYANLKDEKPDNFDTMISRFLIDYRNTKHCATGESPAKIMFGRELKTRFSLLKPPTVQEKNFHSQERAISNAKGNRDCQFKVGQNVFVRDYTDPNKAAWQPAVIDKCFGPRNYSCILANNNRNIKRHLDQIRIAQPELEIPASTSDSHGETDGEHEQHSVRANPHENRTIVSDPSESPNALEPIEISSGEEEMRSAESNSSDVIETDRSLQSTPKANPTRRSVYDSFKNLF